MIAHLASIRRTIIVVGLAIAVVLALLWITDPPPTSTPSPQLRAITSEPITPVGSTALAAANELSTPWPDVLPCDRFATLAIHGFDFEAGMPIRWETRDAHAIRATAPFSGSPRRIERDFAVGDYTRLVLAHDLTRYQFVELALACANDADAGINWICRRPLERPDDPVQCTVEAAYPARFRHPKLPVDRVFAPGALDANAGALVDGLVDVVEDALITACAAGPCAAGPNLAALRLSRSIAATRARTAHGVSNVSLRPKHVDVTGDDLVIFEATWDTDDGAITTSCMQHPILCSVESAHRWAMTYTADYIGIRLDGDGFVAMRRGHAVVGGDALSLRVHN